MSLVFTGREVNPTLGVMPGQLLPETLLDEPPGIMNIVIVKGDSKTVALALSMVGYEGLDLDDAEIKFTVKGSPQDEQSAALLVKTNEEDGGITVVDAEAGTITIAFLPADTEDMEDMLPQTCDIQVVSGEDKYTLKRGVFTVTNGTTS